MCPCSLEFQLCFWFSIILLLKYSRCSFWIMNLDHESQFKLFPLAFLSGLNMKSLVVEKRRIVSLGPAAGVQEAAAVLLHQIYRRPLHLSLVHLHTLCCTCIPSKDHTPHHHIKCCTVHKHTLHIRPVHLHTLKISYTAPKCHILHHHIKWCTLYIPAWCTCTLKISYTAPKYQLLHHYIKCCTVHKHTLHLRLVHLYPQNITHRT